MRRHMSIQMHTVLFHLHYTYKPVFYIGLLLAIYTFCRCLGLYTCVFAYMCLYVLYIAQESWYAHQHVEYLLSQSYLFCSVYNLCIFDCINYYIYLRASWKISLFAKCCHPHKIKSLLTYLLTQQNLVTMMLHQPGPQLKLPTWRNKSIYAISV